MNLKMECEIIKISISYLDGKLVLRESGVNHHNERERNECLLFLAIEELVEVLNERHTVLI